MNPIRILIASHAQEERAMLIAQLKTNSDILVVGEASNGSEALSFMHEHETDVLIMDLFMPFLDGFGVLEAMRTLPHAHHPQTIVLSAVSSDDVIARSIDLGAAHCIVKPFYPEMLALNVLRLGAKRNSSHTALPAISFMQQADMITRLLLSIGVPAHLQGFNYLRAAVKQGIEHPNQLMHVTRAIYPEIAATFNTSPGNVERSIRHALDACWQRGHADVFNRVLGFRALQDDNRPGNCEFIALLCERMQMSRHKSA